MALRACDFLDAAVCLHDPQVFSGEYQVAVGGHQPGDELGEATSNVVTGSFKISEAEAHVVPRPDRG